MKTILTILFLFSFFTLFGGDYATEQGALSPLAKTLQTKVNGMIGLPPVIMQNSNEELAFEWDILASEPQYLRYAIKHCDAQWQPSNISEIEYVDGINEAEIIDFELSMGTLTDYVHYRISFPNEEMAPKLSGNYILEVFPENDPDDVWLRFRFMVSEQTANFNTTLSTNTDKDFNKRHQQLAVTADVEKSGIRNPYNDLILRVVQNERDDNQALIMHPLRMKNAREAVYEHLPELIFEAGNEYRRFENVSVYNPMMGVESVAFFEPYYHFQLATDLPRKDDMYLYDETLRGAYIVRNELATNSDTESDYVVVHFTLDHDLIKGADVFIDADFTDRKLDNASLMVYDPERGLYQRSFLLKQGAYSYQYLVVPKGENKGQTYQIEGDKYQTSNQYAIYLYAHNPIDRYDRLIGFTIIKM